MNVVNGGRFSSSNQGETIVELIVTQSNSDAERLSTVKLLMIFDSSVNQENLTELDDTLVIVKLFGELGTTRKITLLSGAYQDSFVWLIGVFLFRFSAINSIDKFTNDFQTISRMMSHFFPT